MVYRDCDMSKNHHKITNGYLWLHVQSVGLNNFNTVYSVVLLSLSSQTLWVRNFLTSKEPKSIFLSTTSTIQLYTIFLILVSALHVSSGFSSYHQELKKCIYSIGYLSNLFAAIAANLMLHVQFLSSWWWADKPLETCRALTTIKNTVWRCILLVVLKNILIHSLP